MSAILEAAGVSKQTWYRWRSGSVSPTVSVFTRDMKSVEATLTGHELALRDYLNDLHPPEERSERLAPLRRAGRAPLERKP